MVKLSTLERIAGGMDCIQAHKIIITLGFIVPGKQSPGQIIEFRCKDPSQDISKRNTANIIKFSKRSQMVMKPL